jgi:hypothetical protein
MSVVLAECLELTVFEVLLEEVAKLFLAILLESTEYRALKSKLAIVLSLYSLDCHLFELLWGPLCDCYLVEVDACALESDDRVAW